MKNEPAFPVTKDSIHKNLHTPAFQYLGMTLKDYFAAKALNGLLAHGICCVPTEKPNNFNICQYDVMAEICFKFADAMLAEREKV